MKFKDVAHLYLGCKLKTPEGIATFDEYNRVSEQPVTTYDTVVAYFTFEQIKPILRPLSSLTDDERKHIDSIIEECNATDYELLRKLIVYNGSVLPKVGRKSATASPKHKSLIVALMLIVGWSAPLLAIHC